MVLNQSNLPMDRIEGFCRKWKVKELALFGSILRDDFRPDSDVDVLVTFEEGVLCDWIWDHPEVLDELREIFGREVDLVEKRALRNPFRRYEILTTKQVIYAAGKS